MTNIIDGNAIAGKIRLELQSKVTEMKESFGVTPGLAVILVGARRDSSTYVRMKKKACSEVGIESFGFDFSAEVTQDELVSKIHELNEGCIFISIFLISFKFFYYHLR